ncbi:MAG: glycosyltransferase family 1 protein [Pseudomonadota bacterium]
MNVAFFSNQFAAAQQHGVARYAKELLDALHNAGESGVVPVAGWSSKPSKELSDLKAASGLKLTGLGRQGTSLAWTFLGFPTIERCLGSHVDVVHAVSLGYPIATRKPYVVTVHDLGPLTHPEYFRNTRPWVMERSLKQAVHKAAAIVCVSESTAQEVRDYAGCQVEDRLHVVHEGVGKEFFEPTPNGTLDRFTLRKNVPFILSAGKLSPRKNLDGLLNAFGRIIHDIPHDLVLVGGVGWDDDQFKAALAKNKLDGRVQNLGYVSDIELRALYRAASVYVQPSLYEGFGLPVIEAMAAGAPVIASNSTSLPEVAGSAARLSETWNDEALAKDILEVSTSLETQAEMRVAGTLNAKRFTWSRCAAEMADVYRHAMNVA